MSFKNNQQLISAFKKLVPNLNKDNLRKGQCGKIGVLGGSKEYTGAPYFAAISSLKVGADLAYVFTTAEASLPIKSYSPELIVLPLLNKDLDKEESDIRNWIARLDSLIIGPGLGRSDEAEKYIKLAISIAKPLQIPLVIDADGLFFVAKDTSLISGYEKCILSPNIMEFKRLYDVIVNDSYNEFNSHPTVEEQCNAVEKLADRLKNVTIIKKGKVDIVSDGRQTVYNDNESSLKRCGGVGDLLSGTLGSFLCWSNLNQEKEQQYITRSNIIAAYSASYLLRESSRRAFNICHRSITASDVLKHIPEVFNEKFEN